MRRWRNWARTSLQGRCAAARGATSRPVRACRSSSAGRGRSSPASRARSCRRSISLASFASFTGYKLADADAPDSFDVMAALLGKTTTGRQSLVQQSTVLSFRDGNWKYIEPSQGPAVNANTNIETGNDPNGQLYDLGPIRASGRTWPRKTRSACGRWRRGSQRSGARAGAGRRDRGNAVSSGTSPVSPSDERRPTEYHGHGGLTASGVFTRKRWPSCETSY